MWPMVVTMATMAWMTAVFFLCEDEEKILRKTQKNYIIQRNSKNNIKISFEKIVIFGIWPNGGQNGHDGLNYSVYIFFKWGEKILRKTQKNYKILKIPKTIFFIKISFEIMSAFWRYMAIYYCVNFFLKGASRHIHSGKFIIQCPCCYLCCVCEEERRERNIGNPKKKIIKPQKSYYFFCSQLFVFHRCFIQC